MRGLTARQQRIFDWVREFRSRHGVPPTVREIGRHFRMASSSAFGHLRLIEKKGFLRRGSLGARSLQVLCAPAPGPEDAETVSVPEVGRVPAGVPVSAEENVEGTVRLSRSLLGGAPGADHFILRVSGESMIEAGILDGDRVVVRRQPTAGDGQIVVALVDGEEATVKRLFREDGRVRLEPANSRMPPIFASRVSIQGVVVCVLRTYV